MFVFNKVEIHSSQGIGNNCAGTFDKIHRKTPAMDSFLVNSLTQTYNLAKKQLHDTRFPANYAKSFSKKLF